MVAIDQASAVAEERRFHIPRPRGWAIIAICTVLICLAGFAVRGFSENGWRLGSELAWRFTCFAYFGAVIAGPLARLIPSLRRICKERRQLVWGFCASVGVYLASILLPNLVVPPGPSRDGVAAELTPFVIFGAGLTLVIAYAASRSAARLLGRTACSVMLGASLSCFWLAYALAGLAYISGPHRPDAFYGFSLSLMIVALLLRFADRFALKIQARNKPG